MAKGSTKKKPRSAKQKANDKRLGAQAKARAKAKKPGAKRAAKKARPAAKKGAVKSKARRKAKKAYTSKPAAAPKTKGKRKGRKMAKRGKKLGAVSVLKKVGVGMGGAGVVDLAMGVLKKLASKSEMASKFVAHPAGNLLLRGGLSAGGGMALAQVAGVEHGEAFAVGGMTVSAYTPIRQAIDVKFPNVMGDIADLSAVVGDELDGLVDELETDEMGGRIGFDDDDGDDDLAGDLATIGSDYDDDEDDG